MKYKMKYKNEDFLKLAYLNKRKSMQEIASELGVNLKTVQYWMEHHGIVRRSRSEATYVKRNPKGDPFQIKKCFNEEEKALFYLGIGLYLGEGTKNGNKSKVALGNSNPFIIRMFLRFLNEICGVQKSKVKLELNIYDDISLKEALVYWSNVTELSQAYFTKPFVREARKGSYKRWSRYGTLTVVVSNKKLLDAILGWCGEYAEIFGGVDRPLHLGRGGSVVEHLHGKQAVAGSIPAPGSKSMQYFV